MSTAIADDGVELFYEETGKGEPIVFVHEFAGDHRSWEPQVRYFGRRYKCIVYAARGYSPSGVPVDGSSYGQARAVSDLVAILNAAGVEKSVVVGNSMGGFCALHFGLNHPARARALVVCGCGYGARPDKRKRFQEETRRIAASFETEGSGATAAWYGNGPARVQYRAKDPRGHAEHVRMLAEHDPRGSALTMSAVQMHRASLYEMATELSTMDIPTLLMVGDEDEGALDAMVMLKRALPRAGLSVLPKSGHLTNLEEPSLFNESVERFLAQVENDRWERRDPESVGPSDTGA